MKFTTISSIVLGASLALAAPAEVLQKRFELHGVPGGDITCPDFAGGDSIFTSAYASNNIDIMLINGKKKGSYPKPFNANNPQAGSFTWENGCISEKVLELPLWKNSAGIQIPWWSNLDFDNNNNKPGKFREYYMLEGDKATWCGAYAHADAQSNGGFVRCTW